MMRILIAALAVCALVTSASAQPHWGEQPHWQHWHGGGWGGGWDHPHYYHPYNPLPGIVGGIVGGWLFNRTHEPEKETVPEADLTPWSKEWYGYCTNKYKSFDPKTGRYLGYDGDLHFCQ